MSHLEAKQACWAITKGHFNTAKSLLPDQLVGSLDEYSLYIECNELELALLELETLGDNNNCKVPYWEALLAAAENMGLPYANRYAVKASPYPEGSYVVYLPWNVVCKVKDITVLCRKLIFQLETKAKETFTVVGIASLRRSE